MIENNEFVSDLMFNQDRLILNHKQSPLFLNVIDLFIQKNPTKEYGHGQYSMYVISEHGILLYDQIDRPEVKPPIQIAKDQSLNLTFNCVDCSP